MTSPASEVYPNSVYKYYDVNGILIYVGITNAGILRNRQHNNDKPWWIFVSRQEVEHFDSRASAHAREVELIEQFRPPFNVQHNRSHADIRSAYVSLAQQGKLSMSFKPLMQEGAKRSISLDVVKREYGRVAFITALADGPLVSCLKHVPGVRVLSQFGQKYGTVNGIKLVGSVARITGDLKLPLSIGIDSVDAKIRYASLKEPREIHLVSVRLFIS